MTVNPTFAWPRGARAAVSLSFDDGRPSQLDHGLPVLARHGVNTTFYVTPRGVEERLEDWRRALASGHEIGNHSLRHTCSGNFIWGVRNVLENYTLEQMDDELADANRRLHELLGVTPVTFAYPCGQTFVGRGLERRSYVPLVARLFHAGRGFREEFCNRPDFCDLAALGGTEMDGVPFEHLVATVEQAAANGQWVVFVGHDVANLPRQCVNPETLERFCSWCQDPAHGVWIDTVAAVAAHVAAARGRPPLEGEAPQARTRR
jgi:peptidoglycan/xylan/chitin deacetylase (PgdA/CDA1 family)